MKDRIVWNEVLRGTPIGVVVIAECFARPKFKSYGKKPVDLFAVRLRHIHQCTKVGDFIRSVDAAHRNHATKTFGSWVESERAKVLECSFSQHLMIPDDQDDEPCLG